MAPRKQGKKINKEIKIKTSHPLGCPIAHASYRDELAGGVPLRRRKRHLAVQQDSILLE